MKSTVIITGGAQGIGKAVSLLLAKNNYNVISLDNDFEAVSQLNDEKNNMSIKGVVCDIIDETALTKTINELKIQEMNIIALINNAGISINKPISQLTLEEWNKVIGTNLTSVFLMSKLLEKELRDSKGSIINIASTRAFMSEANTEAYSASKGGIVALTHALAVSLGPAIRVNCISPGWIDVTSYKKKSINMNQVELSKEDHSQHPVGRVGNPFDIGEMVLFLIEKGGFITGENFIIDGGMTKKMIYV
ncbi:NAD(P)-dependent dehydrogenase (short-subunit alcohol dehydrogenase family) [Natranaerovirga pectinivora]|uniref:NAD(P)-dependent dehydrogenase (Short-subunit alcohol dehydrogenase family) n=1 Tax=Natranaerovirga pectinivora TaxID=682400 RepID=A0A4R3MLX8_9FIRM|nr:SDR family oxidoreductase [Natranaerovirga pectinivora]TCT15056.1 NAD(P)-dependent dehydrogenase (short-subunit alcohol dehydrogenase family) [Natranaerovirga pectinivora]